MFRCLFVAFCLFITSIGTSYAAYTASYTQPKTYEEQGAATQLRDSKTLERIAGVMNRIVSVPQNIPIVGASCGQPNAFYTPEKKAVVVCYELLLDNAIKLTKKYKNQFSQEQINDILLSELVFVVLHEVGHSLIDIYQLPVLGREEDAADKFASFVLLNTKGSNRLKSATMFFHLGKPNWLVRVLNSAKIYGDEHSLAQQRIANLVCWGYGKEPSEFLDIANAIKLPQSRAARCSDEYNKMDRDIRSLLGNNLTIDNQNSNNIQVASNQNSPSTPRTSSNEMIQMAQHYSCMNCHGIENRLIGPSFRDVARKYRGSDMESQLMARVKYGNAGEWGAVPAPPQPNINEYDLKVLIQWITSM